MQKNADNSCSGRERSVASLGSSAKERAKMAKLPDETEERISALEESLTKLEEEIGPLLITPWEQLTRFGTSLPSDIAFVCVTNKPCCS